MLDISVSYGIPIDFIAFLGIFIYNLRPFVSELLYLNQNFTNCVSRFDLSACQMWLKVFYIISVFWEFFIYYYTFEAILLHQTFTNCMLKKKFRNEKEHYVSIYGYVSLVSNVLFISVSFVLFYMANAITMLCDIDYPFYSYLMFI